jgi:hypothetical protein
MSYWNPLDDPFLGPGIVYLGDTPAAGNSVASLTTPQRWDFCSWGSAAEWELIWDAGVGEVLPKDAVIIAGNLDTAVNRVRIDGSSNGVTWSTVDLIDTSDAAMRRDEWLGGAVFMPLAMPAFTAPGTANGQAYRYLRIRLTRKVSGAVLRLWHVWPVRISDTPAFGSLPMERPPSPGSSVPRLDESVQGLNLFADAGGFLGSSVRRRIATGTLRWDAVSMQWIRDYWLPRANVGFEARQVRDILQEARVFAFFHDWEGNRAEGGLYAVDGDVRTTIRNAAVGSIEIPYRRL